jgi:hypothetical protein
MQVTYKSATDRAGAMRRAAAGREAQSSPGADT